jgi:hypothetical protein
LRLSSCQFDSGLGHQYNIYRNLTFPKQNKLSGYFISYKYIGFDKDGKR